MFEFQIVTILSFVACALQVDPAANQLTLFKEKNEGNVKTLTTSAGCPIESKETISTINTNLYANAYLMDSLTHFVREKIPERIVHILGTSAHGYFETTHDISDVCSADFLSEVGKKTPVVVRFSVGAFGNIGPNATRSQLGFAVKFYTEQGNLDLLGINTPIFPLKDPSLFQSFVHVLRNNPKTNLPDPNMQWDYLTRHPESLYIYLMLFGDPGVPPTYRHMSGYPIHTYQVYNASGSSSYVRFQFKPVADVNEVPKRTSIDVNYYTSDLYNSIANCDYPKWIVYVQILSEEDVANAKFDVFDTTKILPEDLYPPQQIGQIVLNRNLNNYFAEVEQAAYNPANVVPGILGSPDIVYQARAIFYRQAQAYRLGANYNKIKVNCPMNNAFTFNRDGVPPVNSNDGGAPNYYPNSFNGYEPYVDENRPSMLKIDQDEPNNFEQAKAYFVDEISSDERTRLVDTITKTLCRTTNDIQDRAVEVFGKIHPDLSNLVAQALEDKQCKQ